MLPFLFHDDRQTAAQSSGVVQIYELPGADGHKMHPAIEGSRQYPAFRALMSQLLRRFTSGAVMDSLLLHLQT